MTIREPNLAGASQLPPDQADIRRQQEIAKVIKEALPAWIRDGRMVTGTLTDAAEQSVSHGLKRGLKGWVMLSPSGDADRICVVQTGADDTVLKLKNTGATGSLAFALWVF